MHCVVVRDTLENRGVLAQLRARIRAEVFTALNDPTDSRPELSRENFLINELIREYLDFNHYKYTSSVLAAGLYVKNDNDLYASWGYSQFLSLHKNKKRMKKSYYQHTVKQHQNVLGKI